MNGRLRTGLAATSGILGVLAIAVGALSAHSGLSYAGMRWVEIGLRYHLSHVAVLWSALLALPWVLSRDAVAARRLERAALAWTAGMLGFSGGLYLQAFFGLRLGGIVPMGAVALMLGWGYAALAAIRLAKGSAE
jgi:uncharacterized membrane protein YgdD (TMEM256/DUF423 family)